MTRVRPVLAALAVSLAAWISQATLAIAAAGGPRIALLPASPAPIALSLAGGRLAYTLARAGASLAPLWLLTLLLLPWLPFEVPAAFLAWDAALRLLVWMAVTWNVVRSIDPERRRQAMTRFGAAAIVRAASEPDRAPLLAGLCALALFSVAAWQVAPSVPSGDEPHYLVITQSLLKDGDLRIENNHRQGHYQAYYTRSLRPDYLRRGTDGEIYSIHAPGLSALIAPAFAIGGYRGVEIFLILVASLGSALAWHVAWLATGDRRAAWFGWAAVTLSSTAIFHAFTVYPDGVGSTIVLTGVWALLKAEGSARTQTSIRPWILHGAALALLPWLHSRFAVLAGGLGALVLLRLASTREPARKAVAFLTIPALAALAWVGFFVVVYGTPDPSAPYGGSSELSLSFVPGGLAGILFDQRFGLIANAPALACAPLGLGAMLLSRRAASGADDPRAHSRRLALEILFIVLPYLLTVTSFAMWWGGWSAPARFAAPVLLVLAIPCAAAWACISHRASRAAAAGALGITAFISAVLVFAEGGRLAFNTREGFALWLDRASRLADLGQGAPAWFRGREWPFIGDIGIWLAASIAAWALMRAVERAPALARGAAFATVGAAAFAAAAMASTTLVWARHQVDGVLLPPAQLALLRDIARDRAGVALSLTPYAALSREQTLSALRIEQPIGRPGPAGRAGRNDRPLLTLPAVPAGRYFVSIATNGGPGWVMLGIGPDQFAIETRPLAGSSVDLPVELPVAVSALIVRGDEDARRSIRSIAVRALEVVANDDPDDRSAGRAVRYGDALVFFLDDRSFPEPDAFWVGGSQRSSVVIRATGSTARLLVRNAPVDNQVTIEAGQWREALRLAPGEERVISVPLDPATNRAAVTFGTSSGFRPSAADPASRDDRFLGIWVRLDR